MMIRTIRNTMLLAIALLLGAAPARAADEPTPAELAVLPLLSEIRARQAELNRRERELAERERSHAELEALVALQLDEVAAQRKLVAERIDAWESHDGARIKQLAKIYSAMKPGRAASLLEELDASLATQILSKMKHKQSAAVMERIEAERALTVSRQVARPLSAEPPKLEGEAAR